MRQASKSASCRRTVEERGCGLIGTKIRGPVRPPWLWAGDQELRAEPFAQEASLLGCRLVEFRLRPRSSLNG